MAISDAQFTAWLKDPNAIRCILVEASARVSGIEVSVYMSTRTFVSAATDTPASTRYEAILTADSGGISSALDIEGTGSTLTFGDIGIHNLDGTNDAMLNYIFNNRDISVYLGDVRWERADFRQQIKGLAGQLSVQGDVIRLPIAGILQSANCSITDATLGGSTNNKDELIPLCFGEPFNISPLLTDPATLEFQYHDGVAEGNVEVRDSGVPFSATDDIATGTFTLTGDTKGRITCTPQGDKNGGTYNNTIKKAIVRLLTGYGESTNRITTGDLDTTQLSAFDTANPQPIGHYITQKSNLLETCNYLASSVGAQLVETALGKIQLLQIDLPATGSGSWDASTSNFRADSFEISKVYPAQAAVKLGYCKNWTVQESLQTGIPQSHKDLLTKEWRTVVSVDATTKSIYRLTEEPEQINTALIVESDAIAEADRRQALWNTQRKIVSFEGNFECIEWMIGDEVTVTYDRHGFDTGVAGMLVSKRVDNESETVTCEVLV